MTDMMSLTASCWLAASLQFGVPTGLLHAVGSVESSQNIRAIAYAENGTYSIGVMQINSSWFPTLAQHGISEAELWKPCVNIKVGAWILAQEIERYGYTWEAIGAYYAGPYNEKNKSWKLRHYREYSVKVLQRWEQLKARRTQQAGATRPKNPAS